MRTESRGGWNHDGYGIMNGLMKVVGKAIC